MEVDVINLILNCFLILIEADESFYGGLNKNRHKDKKILDINYLFLN